ncbi:MAG: biotin/lipoyl-containing protein [Terriglobales bacterium]
MTYDIIIEGKPHRLELERSGNLWTGKLDGKPVSVDAMLSRPNVISMIVNGRAYEVKRELAANDLHVWVNGARYAAEVRDPRSLRSRRAAGETAEGPKKLAAPMPGKVVRVLVKEKDEVEQGQGVVVVEAMKMQNELKSPKKGIVQKVLAAEGAAVNAGDALVVIE